MSTMTLKQKPQSNVRVWFVSLCALFLGLFFLRDAIGLPINYYIIYAVVLVGVLTFSKEEAVCLFLALSSFVSAGLDGVFCVLLFVCVVLKFAFSVQSFRPYSLFLIAVCIVELFWFFISPSTVGVFLTYVMFLLSLFVIQQYPCEKVDASLVVNTFIAFSLVYCIILVTKMITLCGSLEELIRVGMRVEEYQEMSGIHPNQNYLTQICCLNLGLCVLMLSKKYNRLPYIVAIILFGFFGLLTVSKMFMATIVVFSLYLVLLSFKHSVLRGFSVVIVLAALVAVAYALFADTLIDMVVNRFDSEELSSGRISIIKSLLSYMNEHPGTYVWGVGILNVHNTASSAVHASIFELLGGWGVFGLLLAVIYVSSAIKHARNSALVAGVRISGYNYLPMLILLGYTSIGMLFGSSFTVAQITVCAYAIMVKERAMDAI